MNINDKRPNYAERYINHSDIPETRARKRRLNKFRSFTELREELMGGEMQRFLQGCEIKGCDHGSLWRSKLGTLVLLNEPYISEPPKTSGLVTIEVPTPIAPYCGTYNSSPGSTPWTRSLLHTYPDALLELCELEQNMLLGAQSQPEWHQE